MTTKKAWTMSIAASVLLVGLVFVGLFGAGFRFFVVKTPSMATTAPVGTLVVVQPEKSYAVGDIISFQHGSLVYTHRIVGQTFQGWVTQGDLNSAADPLPVVASQIVGKVVASAKYVGFLVDALPWILIGCALVYLVTLLPRVRPSWRWQIRLIGWSLVASVVALWQRPWVNMVMIGYIADSGSGVDMHLVNTGIFPVKVAGTVLSSGQDAVVNQTVIDASGRYSITPQLALNFWWFLALLLICLTPTIVSLFLKVEDPVSTVAPHVDEPTAVRPRLRRIVLHDAFAPAVVILAAVLAITLVLEAGTQSTYSSMITNSTNVAGTRTWFKCQSAETGTANARFVWGLTAIGTQTDLTTNGRNGTMKNNGTAAAPNSSSPCPRDTQGSVMFKGGTCVYPTATVTSNETYSEEIWFNTTNTSLNGKLMGFANTTAPTTQNAYDRHIYIDQTGRVVFGVYLTSQYVVKSPSGTNYANGFWHHVVATSAPGKISLYLDGALVDSRSDTAGQMSFSGYWEVGCGLLNGWQDAAGTPQAFSSYFTGSLRLAAVYDATLTAAQVQEHYLAGTP